MQLGGTVVYKRESDRRIREKKEACGPRCFCGEMDQLWYSDSVTHLSLHSLFPAWNCFVARLTKVVLLLFVGCLTSQQHASVSQGRICTDNFTCCHTEIEAADQTFHLTQSQYTDTGPTSPNADPITPGAWQGSHWSANF